ncbi:MAG TPA: GDSL-type esterase/lipase family protein [Caulobacteraceae bacterium]|nr:GDSL-type esterase/lipase family protein [Caulobacteraceae bacterium]
MSLAALAAASVLAAATTYGCDQALCNAEALDPLFAKLIHAPESGQPRTLHILQIGDSHSAGDSITGPWRDALQARFGSGGRGVLPPGKAFDGFLPHGVHVDQSPGWVAENTFRTPAESADAFGVSGYRLTATAPGAQIMLTAEPQEAFRRVIVCAETGPGAGAYTLTVGAISARITLDTPVHRVDCESVEASQPQIQAVLVTDAGPVTLTSWASFSDNGGIALSNLGVVGAEVRHFARTDDQALGEEFRAYHPDLVVLEFGTNDGFVGHFSAETFESRLREQIRRVRRLSKGAPILVLGAPDAETKRAELKHNDDVSDPITDEGAASQPAPIAETTLASEPENPDEAIIAEEAQRAEDESGERTSAWFSPPALSQVRAIERRVALDSGAAFWDWGMRMGGAGSADRWATATPPLTRADHVHTTTAGGAEVAAMLEADFERAFAAYKASH